MRLKVAWALFVLMVVLFGYGLVHERLFLSTHWLPDGVTAFLMYAAGFALWAVVWLRAPRWLLEATLSAAIVWAAWWWGPLAPLAVLYFLASSNALGRCLSCTKRGTLATLLGASVWMLLLWIALHFYWNRWWIYAIAFAIPLAFRRPSWKIEPQAKNAREGAALALLLFVLGAHFLVSLKPEISDDGLSMHLALPMSVEMHGRWAFDHHQDVWSLMPAGADSLFTGVYVLGGEGAAKLLNFAFLVMACVLVTQLAERWTTRTRALLLGALFASTPIVQLVTGSLFVENIWGALMVGSVVALLEGELVLAAALMGAAGATKLIAVAYAAPVLAIVGWESMRDRRWKTLLASASAYLLLTAPPYAFAYVKSGNPIFPFANNVFKSPDFDATKPFVDLHFADTHPSWDAPYDITFRSEKYIEGVGGAAGFHYFLLLVPTLLLVRRRDQAIVMLVAVGGSALVLAGAPNFRYLYGALPLLTAAIAWTPWTTLAPALFALNLWFLPAAGFYDRDFAFFDKWKKPEYVEAKAPVRVLVDHANRWFPGEPIAFFSSSMIAGLRAPGFTDTWHSESYWNSIRFLVHASGIAEELKKRHIRYVIAPTDRYSRFQVIHDFQTRWLDTIPNGAAGKMSIFAMRNTEVPPVHDTGTLPLGLHDDMDARIEYSGPWLHDPQFKQPVKGTVSYSDHAGDYMRVWFEGRALTVLYTAAANRGIGEVWIDGKRAATVNEYSGETKWQSSVRVDDFVPGVHKLEIRVTGQKDERSAGGFVDLDALKIE